jgi:hypothetical protein
VLSVPSRYLYTEEEYRALNGSDSEGEAVTYADNNDKEDQELLETRTRTDHALYGEGFCLKWRNVIGQVQTSFGRIRESHQSSDGSKTMLYTVEYKNIGIASHLSADTSTAPTTATVSEKVAWGGYVAYVKEIGLVSEKTYVPFHFTWLLPDVRRIDRDGCLVMEVRGFRLLFQAQRSSIPCTLSAGLGLMVTVTDLTGEGRPHFALDPGELLGLGMYAPLHGNDRKNKSVFLVKSFIHDCEPQAYVYDVDRSDGIVFDPTDDKTGKLHDKATQNPLMRVNETDGEESPNVVADFDASGGVQFYLGHGEKEFGRLLIPVSDPLELKVRRVGNCDTDLASTNAYTTFCIVAHTRCSSK